tara:strand:- start:2231 stop:2452 length:222 start_codon:yes stop_codon:yes gene_type:complete
MPILYLGDREINCHPNDVEGLKKKGWSDSKSSPKPKAVPKEEPVVEKVAEKVAKEPVKEQPKPSGTRNKFKTR